MKILFLDIDGVLNSIVWTFVMHKTTSFSEYPKDDIDCRSVDVLNILFEAVPDVKVVISSSWRKIHTLDELKEILSACGFKGEIIDKTPNGPTGWRGEEVQMWMNEHPEVTHIACIDDGSDFHAHQNLVQTNLVEGVTLRDVHKLIKIYDNSSEILHDLNQIFR